MCSALLAKPFCSMRVWFRSDRRESAICTHVQLQAKDAPDYRNTMCCLGG